MLYLVLIAVLIGLDQIVKFLVRAYIPLGASVPFIPHVMDLTYWRNTGAAFSFLSNLTWLVTIISIVITVVLAGILVKKVVTHPLGVTSICVILAGAVGNLIDRILFGFVTDMFQTTFIRFAVFNVADICVVLGAVALAIYVQLYYKKENKDDAADADRT